MKQQAAVKESVHARVVEMQQAQAHGISALSEANILLRSQLTACRDHLQRVLPMQHETELAAVSRDAKVKALQLEAQVRPRRMFVIMSDSKGGKCVCVGA